MPRNNTHQLQHELIEYCRSGDSKNLSFLDENRLKHYRRLVFNIIEDTLSTAYPIAFTVLEKDEWNQMLEAFFSEHKCLNPQVWKMPFELIEYVKKSKLDKEFNKPWLPELLYFEWLEIEIYSQKNGIIPPYTKCENYLQEKLILNPDFKIIEFEYPVHRFNKKNINETRGNYYILTYRSTSDYKVYFLEINRFLKTLIEMLFNSNSKLETIVKEVCDREKIKFDEQLEKQSIEFIKKLETKGIVLGKQ